MKYIKKTSDDLYTQVKIIAGEMVNLCTGIRYYDNGCLIRGAHKKCNTYNIKGNEYDVHPVRGTVLTISNTVNCDTLRNMFLKLYDNTKKYYPDIQVGSARYSTTQYVSIVNINANRNPAFQFCMNKPNERHAFADSSTAFVWHLNDIEIFGSVENYHQCLSIPYFNKTDIDAFSLSFIMYDEFNVLAVPNGYCGPDYPLIYDYYRYKKNLICDKHVFVDYHMGINFHVGDLYFNRCMKNHSPYGTHSNQNSDVSKIFWIKWEDIRPRKVTRLTDIFLFDKLPHDTVGSGKPAAPALSAAELKAFHQSVKYKLEFKDVFKPNEIDEKLVARPEDNPDHIYSKYDMKKNNISRYTCAFTGVPIYEDCYVIDIFAIRILEKVRATDLEAIVRSDPTVARVGDLQLPFGSYKFNRFIKAFSGSRDNKNYIVGRSGQGHVLIDCILGKKVTVDAGVSFDVDYSVDSQSSYITRIVKFSEPVQFLVSPYAVHVPEIGDRGDVLRFLEYMDAKYLLYRTFCPTTCAEVIDGAFISPVHRKILHAANEFLAFTQSNISVYGSMLCAGKDSSVFLCTAMNNRFLTEYLGSAAVGFFTD